MKTFAILMALLGTFTALVYHFSFWVSFGIVYFVSMLLLTVISFMSRNRGKATWDSSSEFEVE